MPNYLPTYVLYLSILYTAPCMTPELPNWSFSYNLLFWSMSSVFPFPRCPLTSKITTATVKNIKKKKQNHNKPPLPFLTVISLRVTFLFPLNIGISAQETVLNYSFRVPLDTR